MTKEEIIRDLKDKFRKAREYIYMNYPEKLTKEIIEEVEGKQQTINYATLYEAYLNTSDKLKESDYKLYQIEKYLDEELVYTKDGLQFLKYTKEGRALKGIIEGKHEYKTKRK